MADIWVDDVIGRGFFEDGITAEKIRDQLAGLDKGEAIELHINSPGGDVFEAVAIKSLLDAWEGQITKHIEGIAASAATVVMLAGDGEILMADGSMMMIHDPWTVTIGDAAEHDKQRDVLNKIAGNLAGMYANKAGIESERAREAMLAETWFTAAEAIEFGLADGLTKTKAKDFKIPAAFAYKHPPKSEAVESTNGAPVSQVPLSVQARRRQIEAARRGIWQREGRK